MIFRQALSRIICWLVVIGMGITGCAALIPTPATPPHGVTRSLAFPGPDGILDVCGAIELHSRFSHDGTTPVQIIARIATATDLDFVIITDHNTLAAKPQEQSRGRPFVLVGMEISTSAGHLLAFPVTQEISKDQPVERIIDEIHAQGGLAIVSDPTSPKKPWSRWDLPVDGLAIVDLNNQLFQSPVAWILVKALLFPNGTFWHSSVRRPANTLDLWDRQLQVKSPLVGIGSHDTHAHIGLTPFMIDSYQSGFRLMSTHVFVHGFTPEAVYEGIRRGHCYVSFDGVADPRALPRPFMYAMQTAHRWVLPGDRVRWEPGLTATVQLPRNGTSTMYRDGRVLGEIRGRQAQWVITQPGIYRLEVSLRGRPWIFSNPIYVEPAP